MGFGGGCFSIEITECVWRGWGRERMALTLTAWLSPAGAWLVPKIFNGDIKIHRLSSKVEGNKHVIVKKLKLLKKVHRGHWGWFEVLLHLKASSLCVRVPLTNEIGLVLWSLGSLFFLTELPLPGFAWVIAACMRGESETEKNMRLYSD